MHVELICAGLRNLLEAVCAGEQRMQIRPQSILAAIGPVGTLQRSCPCQGEIVLAKEKLSLLRLAA
jgi:hypothetical protein